MSIFVFLVAGIAMLPIFSLAAWLWLEVTGANDEMTSLANSSGLYLSH